MKLFRIMSVLACLFSYTNAWPQAGTGELTGLVTDPTGAIVIGAQLELTNIFTGSSYSTVTSSAGIYRFVALSVVGTYNLSLQQSGFKAAKIEGIPISVGTTLARDIVLEIGSPQETIIVAVEDIETAQIAESAVSTLVDRNVWQNMPLEIRSQNSFVELVAGAVPDDMAGSTRGAVVNGARGGAGNYLVEGVDNNDQGQGGAGQISALDVGGAAISISPDAITEYRVITNSFNAEYGKAGGFITDTVLKSGDNEFHGSMFVYNRIQALAAQHFFANKEGKKDSLVRNQFGFSLGGPVVKDKSHIFYAMEWHRMRQSEPLYAVGTTRQFLNWVDSGGLQEWAESNPNGFCVQTLGTACPGRFANSAKLGASFNKMIQQGPFPLATGQFSQTGKGFYTSGMTYPVPVYGDVFVQNPFRLNEYRISAKGDHAATERDQLSFLYLNQTANSVDQYGGGIPGKIGPALLTDGRGQNMAITWIHTFNPTVANSFKASYLRHRTDYLTPEDALGTPMVSTVLDPLTVMLGPLVAFPQFFTNNQYQLQDHLSVIYGKHSFKAGWEYRRIRNGSSFYYDIFASFYPYGIEDLVTDFAFTDEADLALFGRHQYGSVYLASAAVDPTTGRQPDVYRGYRANEVAAYFQDDWRIHPRLTINVGIRYEYFGPPHNFRPDIDSNFYFGTPVVPVITDSNNPFLPKYNPFYARLSTGTMMVRNNEIWNKDTNNFAPRLGFAFDVLGNHRLVLRAGAGIMYDRIYNNVFENIRFNPPYFSDNQIGALVNGVPAGALSTPGLYTVPFSSRDMFNEPRYAPTPNPRHMDQNMVSPYYQHFHLGVEWGFMKGYALGMEYVGNIGRKLIGWYDINTFNGRTAGGYSSTRINTDIGEDNYRNNNFFSNYHGMQLILRKYLSSNLGFNLNYTWSKALDIWSDFGFGRSSHRSQALTDTMDPRADYGPADFHMRHRFVATLSYELPFFQQNRFAGGWQINTIISLQSGVPFSPYSISPAYDLNKDGRYNDRLVYAGSGRPMDSVTGKNSPADSYFEVADWETYNCSSTVNSGLWCNSPQGRNSMTGPGFKNVDFSIQKKLAITEQVKLSLQGNFFNIFNHTNFDLPDFDQTSISFGRSTATFSPRITQLALRLDF